MCKENENESKLSGSTPLAKWKTVEPKAKEPVKTPEIKEPINWAGKFSWMLGLLNWLKGSGGKAVSSSKGVGSNLYAKIIYEPMLSLSFIVLPLMIILAITQFFDPAKLNSNLLATLGVALDVAALCYTFASWMMARDSDLNDKRNPVPVVASFIAVITIIALNMVILLNSVFSEIHIWMIGLGCCYFVSALGLNIYRAEKEEKWDE